MSQLQKKLKSTSEDYDSLRRHSEALLQEKDAELKSIKDSMTATKQQVRLCMLIMYWESTHIGIEQCSAIY